MIDIELIIKLIKLANNNPNDNEANLAARKACKMLVTEKGEFIFRIKESRPNPAPRTWDDVERSTEPFWKPAPPTRPGRPFNKENTTPPKSYDKGPNWTAEEYAEYLKKVMHVDFDVPDLDDIIGKTYAYGYDPRSGTKKQTRYDSNKKKKIVCTKCNQEVETGFVGPPQVFVCTPCQWQG